MTKKAKKTTPKPNQNETKEQPKEAPKPNNLQYQQGNGEFLAIQLLTLMCNKLDEMRNHTRVLVEQNDEIIKLLKKDNVEDI